MRSNKKLRPLTCCLVVDVEVVVETMRWHCIDCKGNFQGPMNKGPGEGCPHCKSRNVFDCNLEPATSMRSGRYAGHRPFLP